MLESLFVYPLVSTRQVMHSVSVSLQGQVERPKYNNFSNTFCGHRKGCKCDIYEELLKFMLQNHEVGLPVSQVKICMQERNLDHKKSDLLLCLLSCCVDCNNERNLIPSNPTSIYYMLYCGIMFQPDLLFFRSVI